jgi:pyruvate/2-oxoglutarate dehydrogenase complex dihydrolipoamide dehydrogenase (E3) component
VDRARTDNETSGLVKLIVRKGRILGASVLGPHGGEILQEIVLAMKTGAKIGDISATIHAYPTLSQVNRRAVNTAFSPRLFSAGTRKAVRWINRLLP